MTKTLGQILYESKDLPTKWDELWSGEKQRYNYDAAGIAAVARHVFAEMLAAHLADHHAKPVEPEPAKGEDWAMECVRTFRGDGFGMYGGERGTGPSEYDKRTAAIIREAAERHYGDEMLKLRNAVQDMATNYSQRIQERDAARAECERLQRDVDGMMKVLDTPQPVSQPTPPPAAVAGDDEFDVEVDALHDAVRNGLSDSAWLIAETEGDDDVDAILAHIHPLFDTIRRERDEWKAQAEAERGAVPGVKPVVCTKCHYTPGTSKQKYCGDGSDKDNGHRWRPMDEVFQRAESAEAALAELRAAVDSDAMACKRHDESPVWCRPSVTSGLRSPTDAILAAYRAAKGEPRP